ncbi:MAG: mechanosensitive ion channel family protein [Leptolyngbyaceae cyanobacterium]
MQLSHFRPLLSVVDQIRRYGRRGLIFLCVGVVCLLMQSWSVTVLAQTASPETDTTPSAGQVRLDNELLFTLDDRSLADSVEVRAERISQRIHAVANNPAIAVDDIDTTQTEFGEAIFVEDTILFVISDVDAMGTDSTPEALAEQYADVLRTEITDYRAERSAEYLTRATIIAVVCTLGLMLAIAILANAMPQFYRWLDRQQDRWIPNVRVQNFELLTAYQLTGIVQFFTQILHFFLVLGLILFYLSYVLSLFPQTRNLGQGVFGYFWRAVQIIWDGFINFLPNLLTIIIIVFAASVVLRFVRWIFANIRRGRLRIQGFYPEWAMPTFRLTQFLIIAFALAVIFPYLPGANSPAFQGVSIFVGLLVSLGAGGAIFSIVAGFILVYTRAFMEGDRIRFDDIEGFVTEKSLFVTRLRTVENSLISVPNTSLLAGKIINYTALIREQQTPLILKTTITLGYDVPWQLVHQTLIEAAIATSYVLQEPAPNVWQTSLDDFYVSYQLRAATLHPDQLDAIYSELHQNLQDSCNQAGIEILSPHYGAMRDGSQTTIPANYLPNDYAPPPWQITAQWQPPKSENQSGK